MKGTKVSDEMKRQIIDMYQLGHLMIDVASKFDLKYTTISKILKAADVKVNHGMTQKFQQDVNVDYFKGCGEGPAYFFGMLLSDGCISDVGTVSITLTQSDGCILESLVSELNIKNKVAYRTRSGTTENYCQVGFTVKEISDDLRLNGMTPRKSLKEICPDRYLNDRHFWRGMIDGDGSVARAHGKYAKISLCGSLEIVGQFLDFCKTINPEISTLPYMNKTGLWYVQVNGRKSLPIMELLYSDAKFFLPRKMNTVKSVLQWYAEKGYADESNKKYASLGQA